MQWAACSSQFPRLVMYSLGVDHVQEIRTIFGDDGKVRVVVDPASAQLLEGATLDYKDGLEQSGFAVTNPNATRSCGCGQSFS